MTTTSPRFHRIAPGDYETADGRFLLLRLLDVSPPAWNIEDTHEQTLVVDGAASKRDALALFTAARSPGETLRR